jgi:hypothetical protein
MDRKFAFRVKWQTGWGGHATVLQCRDSNDLIDKIQEQLPAAEVNHFQFHIQILGVLLCNIKLSLFQLTPNFLSMVVSYRVQSNQMIQAHQK